MSDLKEKDPKISYGGQALIEGVMIRGNKAAVLAVRNPEGELVSVVESKSGRYLPVSFTDEVFDMLFEKESVGGEAVVDNIILAFEFADNDVYRAVTHNKGIMNGIISVANAVGQDSRAIEAAANAYAAISGKYRSLSKWSKDSNGNLVGILEIPLSVGIVGGIANVHPVAKICAKILNVESAQELACVMTATGLAQNYSAIRALSTEGIQKGHMRLHARNLAAAAGATPDQIDQIVEKMVQANSISLDTVSYTHLTLPTICSV